MKKMAWFVVTSVMSGSTTGACRVCLIVLPVAGFVKCEKNILLILGNYNFTYFPPDLVRLAPSPHYSLRHSHPSNLIIPSFRSSAHHTSFLSSACSLWNSLPSSIEVSTLFIINFIRHYLSLLKTACTINVLITIFYPMTVYWFL